MVAWALPATAAPAKSAKLDDQFRAQTQALAGKLKEDVVGWGTARLDSSTSCHWAQLAAPARTYRDNDLAYVIESGGRWWLVELENDGRTEPWIAASQPAVDPPDQHFPAPAWTVRNDRFIRHTQGHRGGYDTYDLAIRAGKLVVLRHELLNDARDGDKPVVTQFARPPAPSTLDKYRFRDTGPAKSAAELFAARKLD